MQVKKQRDPDRSGGDMLEADGPRKNSSCFSNIKIFLISECALMLAQGTVGAYLVSVLTTLERRFNLQSADVGVIASSFEIGNLALILFVSYFGAKAHRPRLIGCGGIVMALGALLSALPEFLTNQYEIGEVWRTNEGRDFCSNSSSSEAQQAEKNVCDNKANTNMMYLLLIGAQVLLGIGATPVQPLGVSYIDDHVKKKDSSLYIGILFSTLVFGPACGFILGSLCTKFYVDAIFIDTSKLNITPEDPRWIGAWWAGFLLCGALLFCSAVLMFGFPQSLPAREWEEGADSEQVMLPPSLSSDCDTPKPSNGVVVNHEPANSPTCCQQLRVIPTVTKQLLSNPVFTCIVLAACMEIAVVAGFAAFLGKYLEQQFNLTTTSANQLLGMTAIPCACLGIFMGGLLVKKLNLSALGAIRMAMLVNLLSTACYVSFLFLGCDTGPVAGVTIPYGNMTLQASRKPEAQCNSQCSCFTSSISPVCGSNGITYLSACLAGCSRTGIPASNISQNLTGCSCISNDSESATAVPGKCPMPGCQQSFLIFLCVICVCSLVGAMAQTPSVIILIRTVSPELKSYALGVLFLLLRLLGFIPPPLIFGAGIDSTCLFWSSDCDKKGACLLYDNANYRHLYVSLAIVLKGVAFLLYTTTWYCLRRNYRKYIKSHEGHLTPTEFYPSLTDGPKVVDRTKFIYNLEDHEFCENMESVL
ncbi:solute carrier organic anion transporter family member 3A1 [Simochromis diagramma]|uniref:solute carrier organic anion transporter family member 3A1 n=1 Tax=Simochromis diagramma TaxID=43689 RepID=UPI001A7EA5A2|nr:solute carrier organic anion transporter family member 3A1 [Simochromis diagramma]XP_039881602.1 solute carrier organic anion transporter family member 3A1 [Simochromis diagramma]XP_039881603.1 solute carrier organic anion transporter family member 3A1 [Simochromis diagramma]XP_039881604.1 solute carrier organic anion transporter family member 3A1 [Simochromis diagramma]